ncbi:MAG: translation initiation factor IF-2 subunit gamma [Candidatus Thermoplasmatota archaeon]
MRVPQQPEVNIGVIGHVDHGKTTLTKTITGEWTDRHSEEIKRGISIKLGYADVAFYKCPTCSEPECHCNSEKCPRCGSQTKLLRAVSFVDAPGHETLMATLLSGAALMNGALLLIAANEACPQPQTKEHLMALTISDVKHLIIVQNKIDIVTEQQAMENHEQIVEFIKGTIAEHAPIVPVCAHHEANIDVLIKAIEERIPTPDVDPAKPTRMFIARSFDVNAPGTPVEKLVGGVIGGTIISGTQSAGEEIEIVPGQKIEEKGKSRWEPIITEVRSLFAGETRLDHARPGGLIAIGTALDPLVTKSDSLIGRVAGKPGTLPEVMEHLTMSAHLLERVVGMTKDMGVEQVKSNEPLMLSVGTANTVGVVTSARRDSAEVTLKIPVAAEVGQRAAISRKIGGKWRLIGYGVIQ